MRTFSNQSTLQTHIAADVRKPWLKIETREALLRFSLLGSAVIGDMDTNVPVSLSMSSATLGYIAGKSTSTATYLAQVDYNNSATFTVGSNNGTRQAVGSGNTALRGSFNSSNQFLTAQWTTNGNPSIIQVAHGGSPTTLATISLAMSNITNFLRRVDAVLWTSLGTICIVGCYDSVEKLATKRFFLIVGGVVTELDTIVQYEYTGALSYTADPVSACASATVMDGRIVVVCNDGKRALFFTLSNGVESDVLPVIPLDPDATSHTFLPVQLSVRNSLCYLNGLMVRRFSDNSVIQMEVYLTSEDGVNWSFLEYSSFIASTSKYLMFPVNAQGSYVYASGGGSTYRSVARPVDTGGAATDVTDAIAGWSHEAATSVADNIQVMAELFTDTSVASIVPGAEVIVSAGYEDANLGQVGGVIGVGVIDEEPDHSTAGGKPAITVAATDRGSWHLMHWNSPTDIDRSSAVTVETDMHDLSTVVAKSPQRDIKQDASGLRHTGLNDPFVGYAVTRDDRDGLVRAKVKFNNLDSYSLSTFGFVFGAGDNKSNVLAIPKPNFWTGHTQLNPQVKRAAVTSWDFPEHQQSVWESVLADPNAKLLSAMAGGTSNNIGGMTITTGLSYIFTLRQRGRLVQLYARVADYSSAAANTQFRLSEFTLDDHTWKRYANRPNFGFLCGTDVFVSSDAFAQAVYDDLDISFTDAGELISMSVLGTSGQRPSDGDAARLINVASVAGLAAGQYIGIGDVNTSANKGVFRITSIAGNTINLDRGIPGSYPGNQVMYVFLQSANDDWAFADSGYESFSTLGGTVITDPGAVKVDRQLKGRAAFVSDDNTAMTIRMIRSDGAKHYLQSGSVYSGGTKAGWDYPTNPLPSSVGAPLYGGSDPAGWRMIFHHGCLFAQNPSAYGLPPSGYMIIDDEIVRYGTDTFLRRGMGTSQTWASVPTYYFIPKAAGAGAASISQWWNGAQEVGDDFALFTPGLLVEVLTRNGNINTKPYHVASVTDVVSPNAGSTSSIALDTPYENEVSSRDVICVSGRGQFASEKTSHVPEAPLRYYPCDYQGNRYSIDVSKFEGHFGLHNTLEDDLRAVCGLSGSRGVTFRSRGYYSGTIGASVQTLAASESDFVLDADIDLGTGFRVNFRGGSYFLDVESIATGIYRLSLASPLSSVTQGAETAKWLDRIPVRASTNMAVSGRHDVRVILKEHLLKVEIDRQLLWVFNLKDYPEYFSASGAVTIQFLSSQSALTTARLIELSEEVEDHIVEMGKSGASALSSILENRHVFFRSTQGGGLEFGSFLTRDNAGTVTENIGEDSKSQSVIEPAGHTIVSGAEFGEYLDEAWLQQNGYRFGMGDNRFASTVSDSAREARTLVRLAKEQSARRTMALMSANTLLQPEDKITVQFANATGTVNQAAEDFVISAVSMAMDKDSFTSQVTARKYYAF